MNGDGGFAIKDCALVAIATGRRAKSLRELRDGIAAIDPGSIYYHFWGSLLRPAFEDVRYHNGFAVWADYALHDPVLAERLGVVDPVGFGDIDRLRRELVDIISERLEEHGDALPWASDEHEFHFVRSQIVVFDTHRVLEDPRELPDAVDRMSRGSVFYHFVDARRRTPGAVDDFRTWLADLDREGHRELCIRLASMDPFFRTLVETRAELAQVFRRFMGVTA